MFCVQYTTAVLCEYRYRALLAAAVLPRSAALLLILTVTRGTLTALYPTVALSTESSATYELRYTMTGLQNLTVTLYERTKRTLLPSFICSCMTTVVAYVPTVQECGHELRVGALHSAFIHLLHTAVRSGLRELTDLPCIMSHSLGRQGACICNSVTVPRCAERRATRSASRRP